MEIFAIMSHWIRKQNSKTKFDHVIKPYELSLITYYDRNIGKLHICLLIRWVLLLEFRKRKTLKVSVFRFRQQNNCLLESTSYSHVTQSRYNNCFSLSQHISIHSFSANRKYMLRKHRKRNYHALKVWRIFKWKHENIFSLSA